MERMFRLLSSFQDIRQKQKERAGKVPQKSAVSEHTLLSKDVLGLCTDRFPTYEPTAQTRKWGLFRIRTEFPEETMRFPQGSSTYSVYNFSIRTIIYIIARHGAAIS